MHHVLQPTGQTGRCDSLQAVLFDMDGLFVDTEPLWFEVEKAVMARIGGSWTHADQQELIGGSMDRSVRYFMERATLPAEPDQVADWLRHGMAELLAGGDVRPMPGAVELAGEARAAGIPCALVTSSEPIIADAVLATLARRAVRFDVVVTGGDVSAPKPDPEPYLLASAKLGADPRCCVALEDSPNGVRSARAAGCVTVAVPGLVPISDASGVHVIGSLTEINLNALRGLIASR